MAAKIPQIKKTISSFLLSEEGKITKQSILSMGLFLGSVAITTALTSDDAAGWHGSHSSHTSHTSHSSHNQHQNDLGGSFDSGTHTVSGTHDHHINNY